jgi:cellulose synthase/poly-beta-1,6-N-acetylglucosamine synthase-like glycosyltransferase
MPEIIFIIGITTGTLYFFMISAFTVGFLHLKKKAKTQTKIPQRNLPKISVISAFRNEADTLPALIQRLSEQNYPKSKYEIICINDHSEDESFKKAQSFSATTDNLRLFNLEASSEGKKAALQYGVSKASYNLICVTDADSLPGKNFLRSIGTYYHKTGAQLINLPVLMYGEGFWNKLQAAEFMSLTASAAGSAGIGFPILSNGAGMAFEKKAFNDINNKEASGDDMFLLHSVKNEAGKSEFLLSEAAVVETAATCKPKSFINQRLRWVSKFKSYKDTETVFAGILVYTCNMFLVAAFALSIFNSDWLELSLVLLFLKIIPDTVLEIVALSYFRKLYLLPYYLLWIPIYPLYAVVLGIAGQLTKNINWKGRNIINEQ